MADIAARYAEALLAAAKHENALQAVTDEVVFLAHEFSRCANIFRASIFPAREQLATVDYVLNDKFHPLTKRFICLLAERRRLGGIGKIADLYVKMAKTEMGQNDLHLIISEETTPEMTSDLTQAACNKGVFDSKYREKLNVHITIDKSLLGGFIAECDGISWDCSLRTRIMDLKKAILRIQG